jgi:hypothetical protein
MATIANVPVPGAPIRSNWAQAVSNNLEDLPLAMAVGSVVMTMSSTSVTYPVTFPAGRFTVIPTVIVGSNHFDTTVAASAVTVTGFSVIATQRDANGTQVATGGARAAYWVAIQ